MSHFTECPPDVAPGDIVRCTTVMGLPEDTALKILHVYVVRSVLTPFTETMLTLKGIAPDPYCAFRFALIARAVDAGAQEASEVATRMADVMRRREAETGSCDLHDLARAGFTAAQIAEFRDEALGLAGAPSELAAA